MRGRSCCIVLTATASILVLTPFPSFAARSPALKACSSQWAGLKKAGKTEGQTWPQFWSQCSKDFAANNPGAATAPEKPTATKATAKSIATARNEDDSAGSAQLKKDCDAKWDANKAKTGDHGWHDYFQFMAKCM
jgi:hypothetical protein